LALPPVGHSLVQRLEAAGAAFSVARLEALRDRPETGLDLQIERFGAAVAPASLAEPELDFVNRIERLGAGDAARLGEILSFYALLGIDPWLELAPGADVGDLVARVVGFHTVLYGVPESGSGHHVEVRRVEGADVRAGRELEPRIDPQ
jgi:hypothetical protein